MDIINIIGTDDIPSVILDAANGKFEMSGRSLPEDVSAFYKPILDWMDKYSESANPKTVFDFKLTYFNTASSKIILDILMKLEAISNDGKEVLIKWHFPAEDEDMEEAGEEYSEIVDVPFEKVKY
ncbi:MAG: nuclear pore complex subunit [Bacteroidetes bacterium GWA2_30_7]|nr:MAG: nuclear pore complex subunit [Bacteroidetes bacterium GWA2_30_7]